MQDGDVAASMVATRDAAFRRLAERHLERSYRLACAVLGNPGEAQDATHDAFVQAWRKWSTLRDPGRFEPWFDRILVNTCRNRLKRAGRVSTHELFADLPVADADAYAESLDRAAIERALAQLSPDHRLVVALRFYRDLTIEEIARLLSIPAGTVQSRLHYALKRLHAALDAADAGRTMR